MILTLFPKLSCQLHFRLSSMAGSAGVERLQDLIAERHKR